MELKVAENATDAATNLAHLTHEVSKAKVIINDVLEDSKHKAQRMVRRGFAAAEDCVEDTTYFIKRHPWQSVGTALGLGVAVGVLAGWMTTRIFAKNSHS